MDAVPAGKQREIRTPEEHMLAILQFQFNSNITLPEILKQQDLEHNISICTKGIKRNKSQDLQGRKRKRAESWNE